MRSRIIERKPLDDKPLKFQPMGKKQVKEAPPKKEKKDSKKDNKPSRYAVKAAKTLVATGSDGDEDNDKGFIVIKDKTESGVKK
jgi:hypothetical protein